MNVVLVPHLLTELVILRVPLWMGWIVRHSLEEAGTVYSGMQYVL